MYKDFEEYGYDVEEFCHRIYSGKEKVTDKRVIISTWQSIYKFGKEWFEQFDSVFGDEVHLFKAKSLTTMMDKCVNAKYRFGLTGTARWDGDKQTGSGRSVRTYVHCHADSTTPEGKSTRRLGYLCSPLEVSQ